MIQQPSRRYTDGLTAARPLPCRSPTTTYPPRERLPIGIQTLCKMRGYTLSPEYSAICGYTEADPDAVLAPELPGLDRDTICDWYNGYNWTGEPVYNPFDVLLLFQERTFRPWWFETATPTYLLDVLTDRQVWLPKLGQLETDAALLSSVDVEHILGTV